MNTLFIVSGYFIHGLTEGHKAMLQSIRSRMDIESDKILVIINNDLQQHLKYKTAKTDTEEIKSNILSYLENYFLYYAVRISIDTDRTVKKTLRRVIGEYYAWDNIIFCNDGDCLSACPEEQAIQFKYLGNPKITSSGEEKN